MTNLLTHVSRYSLASILSTLAGFVSFPILTRMLGADGYGIMAVVNVTLTLWIGLGKFGLQHAGLRFYSNMLSKKSPVTTGQYYATLLFSMAAFGLAFTLLWMGSSGLLARALKDPALTAVILVASPLILIRVIFSGGVNILNAREASVQLSAFSVFHRYFVLAVVIFCLFYISPQVETFFRASVVAELVTLAVLMTMVVRGVSVRPRLFSTPLLKSMLVYGLPLIGFELAGTFLAIGDRFLVQHFRGPEALGAYSAAYNLSMYIQAGLIATTATAAVPAYLKIWENKGREGTEMFLTQGLALYAVIAIPTVVGLSAVSTDIIRLLATDSFLPGAATIPYIIAAQAIGGLLAFFAAGLFIEKRSSALTMLVIGATSINVMLNYVLIPIMSIQGAAIATLASYVFLALTGYLMGTQYVSVHLPWKRIGTASLSATLMYAAIFALDLGADWKNLLVKAALGAGIYFLVMLLIDKEIRDKLKSVWSMRPA